MHASTGTQANSRSWLPLFSLYYFHNTVDGAYKQSKNWEQTMDGIIVGCCPGSNAALVYNPRNKNVYKPDSYRIDLHRLPGSIYSNIKYNEGCSALSNGTKPPAKMRSPLRAP